MSTKNNEQNRDYMIGRFDSDGIKAPESLSEENIFSMLESAEWSESSGQPGDIGQAGSPYDPGVIGQAGSNAKPGDADRQIVFSGQKQPEDVSFVKATAASRKKVYLKRIAAVAACMLVVLAGIPQVYRIATAPPDTSLVNGELYTFSSYDDIEKLIKSMDRQSSGGHGFFRLGNSYEETEDYMTEDAAEADYASDSGTERSASLKNSTLATGDSASPATGSSHSSTYLQVEDVDEADIVKTDGKYIYYVNDRQEVMIMSADKGKTKLASRVGNNGVENYIDDIFLRGDFLITTGMVYDGDDGSAAVVVYDITDRSNPKVSGEFRQSGNIVSSRMVGKYVYLVTNDYVYSQGRVIPECGAGTELSRIPAKNICCVPEPSQSSYIILSAIDTESGKDTKAETHAVFGATDDIYCTDHSLYAAVSEYDYEKSTNRTRIIKADIDGLKIRFKATAAVTGYINNQFSMDEHDGYFRIATTSQRNGMDVNNLFVLDRALNVTGKIAGFARNESIRAVRFIGDMAYVITYEAIDPLFIMDLSDPANPQIRGEVKIDGFSSLLVPVSKDHLLGIGYATGDNGYGGEYASGLKLALFDISDPLEPKVASSKEFEDMDSPSQYTHKALTVNDEEGWYAIPYSVWHDMEVIIDDESEDEFVEDVEESAEDEYGSAEVTDADEVSAYDAATEPVEPSGEAAEEKSQNEDGVLVFSADGKIKVIDQHKLGSSGNGELKRCVYIDEYIYALDSEGEVKSFKFK